jgi:DNA-binding HxlR family transcriptional regulator
MIHTYRMETKDAIAEAAAYCEMLTDEQDEISREVMSRIADKWHLWVVHVLAEAGGPLRFSRLLERVEGISQKMLTQTLRQLERDGLVDRTLYPQVPPRVEYDLTPLGHELLVEVAPLWRWIIGHVDAFAASRQRFDAAETERKSGSAA